MKAMMCRKWWMLGVRKDDSLRRSQGWKRRGNEAGVECLSFHRSQPNNSTIIQLLAVRPALSSDFSSQIP
jgi:hypothetical protein